jgi:hypothetical protein
VIGVAAAILLAVAALVVGIIGLVRPGAPAHPSTPSAAPTSSTQAPAQTTTDADRALCTAIGPLMADYDREARAYSNLGTAGSPEWTAGLPKFITATKDWVSRIQPIITSHAADADPFLTRSMQRFIDDRRYLIDDLTAGPFQPYDDTIWMDSLSAYSAPLSICYDLGVKWG